MFDIKYLFKFPFHLFWSISLIIVFTLSSIPVVASDEILKESDLASPNPTLPKQTKHLLTYRNIRQVKETIDTHEWFSSSLTKEEIQHHTVHFFEGCTDFYRGIEETIEVFAACSSPEEAFYLQEETLMISKAVAREGCWSQVMLLKDIAKINPEDRSQFIKQLKRFTQKNLLGNFFDISSGLSKFSPLKSQYLTDFTLDFLELCPDIHASMIENCLKVFSDCSSSEEIRNLIYKTYTISKAVKTKDHLRLNQTFLLQHIASVKFENRFLFVQQLERFAQKNLWGNFHDISDALAKYDPQHHRYFTDITFVFFNECADIYTGAVEEFLKLTLNESYPYVIKKEIYTSLQKTSLVLKDRVMTSSWDQVMLLEKIVYTRAKY